MTPRKYLILTALLGASFSAAAQVAPSAGMLPLSLPVSKDNADFTWLVKAADTAAVSADPGVSVSSQRYWLTVSAGELNKGVQLPATAAGAVIQVAPLGRARDDKVRFDEQSFIINTPRGQSLSLSQASRAVIAADENELVKQTYIGRGITFQLGDNLAGQLHNGGLILQLTDRVAADTQFLLHVYDRESREKLMASSAQRQYWSSDGFSVDVWLQSAGAQKQGAIQAYSDRDIDMIATLVAPDGHRQDAGFYRGDDKLTVQVKPNTIDPQTLRPGQLWEIHIDYRERRGDGEIRRNLRLPLAITERTAQLDGSTRWQDKYTLQTGVSIYQPGRYEVRAHLYHKDAEHRPQPLAIASSAAWLQSSGDILLKVDPKVLNGSAANGPYFIGKLELIDQSRLGKLDVLAETIALPN